MVQFCEDLCWQIAVHAINNASECHAIRHGIFWMFLACNMTFAAEITATKKNEGLAVASIVRDDPSTLPGYDPFLHAH